MAGNNILGAASISPQVLVSQQLGTTETAVYTVGASQSVKVAHGTICNVTANMPAPTLTLGTLGTTSVTAPTLSAPSTATTGGSLAAATYYYKATATNAFGETAASAEVSVTTTGTTSTVTLNWAAIAGATGYKIYRGTAAGSENALVTTITSGSTATFTDTGAATTAATPPSVATTTTQFWKVSALNAAGETLASNEVSAGIGPAGSAPLLWTAVVGAVSYDLYRGTAAGGENVMYNTTATSYTDTAAVGTTKSPVTAQTTAGAVTVYLSVVKAGGAVGDGTHRIVNAYSLAANDTLPLRDYLASAMLGPGDSVAGYASAAGSVDIVITGTVQA